MSFGFFQKEQTTGKPKTSRRTPGCGKCKLRPGCISPKMPPSGDNKRGLLLIGDSPGKLDDEANKHFVGNVGKFLRKKLRGHRIDLDRDCRTINAVNCRPPGNRSPSTNEVAGCRPMIWKEINSVKPNVILLMGTAALDSFLGHRWLRNLGGINKWRGFAIPDRETGAWVFPLFDPKYVYLNTDRNTRGSNPVVEVVFDQDLARAVQLLNEPFPDWGDETEMVKVTKDPEKVLKFLNKLLKRASKEEFDIAFDFETSGKKPHARGHFIASCGISDCCERAVAFPLDDERVQQRLAQVLEHENIGTIAHDLKFEGTWARFCLNARLGNPQWDSMLASHVIDNRQGVCSLKFQTYVRFGVIDYESSVSPFLKSKEERNANAINRVVDAPLRELLVYNAKDALFTYRLAMAQMKELYQ